MVDGRCSSSCENASSPPAEAPTPTIGKADSAITRGETFFPPAFLAIYRSPHAQIPSKHTSAPPYNQRVKIAYLDAFSGISGDMTVGALLDAGAPADALIDALEQPRYRRAFRGRENRARRHRSIEIPRASPDDAPAKHRHLSHILR